MKTNQLSRVMHLAHANWQHDTWSNRLKQAWRIADLRRYLAHGLVKFTFTKKDGTTRHACGTLCQKLIPEAKRPTGARQARISAGIEQPNYTAISYYDLDKDEWRSFAVDSLTAVDEVFLINS